MNLLQSSSAGTKRKGKVMRKFGKIDEVRDILKPIYDARAERLHRSGLDLSKDEFLAVAAG